MPSAPGFVGTFHAAGRYALELFGVGAVAAISFATVYHLFSVVICLLLGLISYMTSNFRLESVLTETDAEVPDGAAATEFGRPEEYGPNR